jgi:hypothetical protein
MAKPIGQMAVGMVIIAHGLGFNIPVAVRDLEVYEGKELQRRATHALLTIKQQSSKE